MSWDCKIDYYKLKFIKGTKYVRKVVICNYFFVPITLQLGYNFVWEIWSFFNIKFHVQSWVVTHEF